MLFALVGAAAIGVTVYWSSTGQSSGRLRPILSPTACAKAGRDAKKFAEQNGGPAEQVGAEATRACLHAKPVAATPVPAATSPGCRELPPDGARRVPLRRRTVRTPNRRVPYFAKRSGVAPPSGAPTVAGVRLPDGSRCPRYWASDRAVPDPFALAARLADAFPRTGLWPVLWDAYDDPDAYMTGAGNPATAARVDAAGVLRGLWAELDGSEAFPGLARGSALSGTVSNPFDVVASLPTGPGDPPQYMLLLVPATRPSDVMSVLAPEWTEYMSDDQLTAVLRSWEERFGAVITTMAPGVLGLVVGAPPTGHDQALALADEQVAFAPDDDASSTEPGARKALVRALRAAPTSAHYRSRVYWPFGWPD
jgi:hypothetical protein